MSYRRKTLPANSLTTVQQLARLCNASAGGTPFQSHNAMFLISKMKQHYGTQYELFTKKATVQKFFPARSVEGALMKDAVGISLPLPIHFINPEDSAENFEPRVFFHACCVDAKERAISTYMPRCGQSGLFFAREEVIDNLQAAANDLGFQSPFWIRPSHPAFLSGYLSVKDDSEAICISLTSSVTSIDNVADFATELLHPSLHKGKSGSGCGRFYALSDDIPVGMNAITGFVSANPFFGRLPQRGLWISQEQLLQCSLSLKNGLSHLTDAFTLIETEQWELYNADQLTVPGRLALRQCLPPANVGAVFQSV